MKTHLTTEDIYDLAYDKLDVSNIKVDKEEELAQMFDLEWDEEAGAYLNPDIYYCSKCLQPQDHSFSSSCCGAIASYDPKGTDKVINVMHCYNQLENTEE